MPSSTNPNSSTETPNENLPAAAEQLPDSSEALKDLGESIRKGKLDALRATVEKHSETKEELEAQEAEFKTQIESIDLSKNPEEMPETMDLLNAHIATIAISVLKSGGVEKAKNPVTFLDSYNAVPGTALEAAFNKLKAIHAQSGENLFRKHFFDDWAEDMDIIYNYSIDPQLAKTSAKQGTEDSKEDATKATQEEQDENNKSTFDKLKNFTYENRGIITLVGGAAAGIFLLRKFFHREESSGASKEKTGSFKKWLLGAGAVGLGILGISQWDKIKEWFKEEKEAATEGVEMISVGEALENVKDGVYEAIKPQINYIKEHSLGFGGLYTLGLLTSKTFRTFNASVLKLSVDSLVHLAKVPFKVARRFPIGSFFMTLAALKYAGDIGEAKIIPADFEEFKKFAKNIKENSSIARFIRNNPEAEAKINGFTESTDEELKHAHDILTGKEGLEGVFESSQQFAKDLMDYASSSTAEALPDAEKRAQRKDKASIDAFRNRVDEHNENKKYDDLLAVLDNIRTELEARRISKEDIEKIKQALSAAGLEYSLELNGEKEFYVLTIPAWELTMHLGINPDLSDEEANEVARTYVASPDHVLGNVIDLAAQSPAEAAQRIADAFREGESIEEMIRNGGTQILIEGGKMYITGGVKTFYLGPLNAGGKVLDVLLKGKDIDLAMQELLLETSEGIVPAMVFVGASAVIQKWTGLPVLKTALLPYKVIGSIGTSLANRGLKAGANFRDPAKLAEIIKSPGVEIHHKFWKNFHKIKFAEKFSGNQKVFKNLGNLYEGLYHLTRAKNVQLNSGDLQKAVIALKDYSPAVGQKLPENLKNFIDQFDVKNGKIKDFAATMDDLKKNNLFDLDALQSSLNEFTTKTHKGIDSSRATDAETSKPAESSNKPTDTESTKPTDIETTRASDAGHSSHPAHTTDVPRTHPSKGPRGGGKLIKILTPLGLGGVVGWLSTKMNGSSDDALEALEKEVEEGKKKTDIDLSNPEEVNQGFLGKIYEIRDIAASFKMLEDTEENLDTLSRMSNEDAKMKVEQYADLYLNMKQRIFSKLTQNKELLKAYLKAHNQTSFPLNGFMNLEYHESEDKLYLKSFSRDKVVSNRLEQIDFLIDVHTLPSALEWLKNPFNLGFAVPQSVKDNIDNIIKNMPRDSITGLITYLSPGLGTIVDIMAYKRNIERGNYTKASISALWVAIGAISDLATALSLGTAAPVNSALRGLRTTAKGAKLVKLVEGMEAVKKSSKVFKHSGKIAVFATGADIGRSFSGLLMDEKKQIG